MDEYIWVLVAALYLCISAIFAVGMNRVAEDKGYPNSHAFILVFLFGLFGMLYVLALPDLVAREQREDILQILLQIKEKEGQ